MKDQTFKWWYAIVGYLAYNIAIIVNTLFSATTEHLFAGVAFNSGALYNGTLFVFAALICLLLFRIISKGKLSRSDFGFRRKSLGKSLLLGFVFGLLFFLLSEFVEMNNKALRDAGKEVMDSFNIGQNLINDLLMVLGVGLLAPVAEEIVFRGAVFNPLVHGLKRFSFLPKWAGFLIAIAVSTSLFVSTHGGGGQEVQLGLLAVLAIFAALAFYFTKNLLAAIFLHAVNNNIVFMYAVSKLSSVDSGYKVQLIVASVCCLFLTIPVGYAFARLLPKK